MENPRGTGDSGKTDLRVETVIKTDGSFKVGRGQVIELPHYLPVDPPHLLLFCDVVGGRLDPFRGVPLQGKDVLEYLRGGMALDPKNRTKLLLYYFRYLDHADPELSNDAYGEFAKADDREIGQVAAELVPTRLRAWLKDPRTPAERLSLYAFLLGGCGGDAEAALLKSMLEQSDERTTESLAGILAGYIHLRPREGWARALELLSDEEQPFPIRYSVLKTARFYHGWKPDATRAPVLRALAAALSQADLADLAMDDLRKWHCWDLTKEVLEVSGRKTHGAPVIRRAILKYALACPGKEAAAFVEGQRKRDARMVQDTEELLKLEAPTSAGGQAPRKD